VKFAEPKYFNITTKRFKNLKNESILLKECMRHDRLRKGRGPLNAKPASVYTGQTKNRNRGGKSMNQQQIIY